MIWINIHQFSVMQVSSIGRGWLNSRTLLDLLIQSTVLLWMASVQVDHLVLAIKYLRVLQQFSIDLVIDN